MNDNAQTHDSKLNTDPSLETLAELFKEQLRLLGRMIAALRSVRPPHKPPPPPPELTLDIAEMKPRVAYERDEELAATD
jgi:hypothetical protein